jgi:dTDP-4-dehydrorhamnose reductase
LRILVTGASGLLGQRVAQLALENGHKVYTLYKEHKISLGNPIKLDLTDQEKLLQIVLKCKPEAIIHTAAYTNVDGCEINRELAWKINAEATKHIAVASANTNSHLTYVSTDYVFDGEKGFYTESDKPNPINYYGYSKLKGEELVQQYAEEWCITRPSVIYGWSSTPRQNFATWLLHNLKQRKKVKVLTDQYVSPTLNTNLAEMLIEIAEEKIEGTFHTAGATRINRYKFALKLAEVYDLDIDLIKPAKMNEMPWKAKRPKDSSLNINKAHRKLKNKPLKIQDALERMKKEEWTSVQGNHSNS